MGEYITVVRKEKAVNKMFADRKLAGSILVLITCLLSGKCWIKSLYCCLCGEAAAHGPVEDWLQHTWSL
jgi:hypothetical protein